MSLRQIVLLVKNARTSASFFESAIGLKIMHESTDQIQMNSPTIASTVPIILKESTNVSQLTTGYTPILCFDVNSMDNTLTKALEMGAVLDGPIKYPIQGKFASIKSPDGFMIGLFEPAG